MGAAGSTLRCTPRLQLAGGHLAAPPYSLVLFPGTPPVHQPGPNRFLNSAPPGKKRTAGARLSSAQSRKRSPASALRQEAVARSMAASVCKKKESRARAACAEAIVVHHRMPSAPPIPSLQHFSSLHTLLWSAPPSPAPNSRESLCAIRPHKARAISLLEVAAWESEGMEGRKVSAGRAGRAAARASRVRHAAAPPV